MLFLKPRSASNRRRKPDDIGLAEARWRVFRVRGCDRYDGGINQS